MIIAQQRTEFCSGKLLRLALANVSTNHAWFDPRTFLDCSADLGAQFLVLVREPSQTEQLPELFLAYAFSILFMDGRIEQLNGLTFNMVLAEQITGDSKLTV